MTVALSVAMKVALRVGLLAENSAVSSAFEKVALRAHYWAVLTVEQMAATMAVG